MIYSDNETTITINKPLNQSFKFLATDFLTNYPKWTPNVVDVKPLSENILQKGAKIAVTINPPNFPIEPDSKLLIIQGQHVIEANSYRLSVLLEIIDYTLNSSFSFKTVLGTSYGSVTSFTFSEIGNKTCLHIRQIVEVHPILKEVYDLLPKMEDYFQEFLHNLENVLEHETF